MHYLSSLAVAIAIASQAAADPHRYSEAASLIKRFEGVRTAAYLDSGGVPTIGAGITSDSPCVEVVHIGMSLSVASIEDLLQCHIEYVDDDIERMVEVPLSANQRLALISFVFNIGKGQFATSTLLLKLNAGDYAGAAEEFDRWVWDNGEVLPGLVSRRAAERRLFEMD